MEELTFGSIIKALRADPYYGLSDEVELAKGKNELTHSWRDIREKLKRKKILRYVRKRYKGKGPY